MSAHDKWQVHINILSRTEMAKHTDEMTTDLEERLQTSLICQGFSPEEAKELIRSRIREGEIAQYGSV